MSKFKYLLVFVFLCFGKTYTPAISQELQGKNVSKYSPLWEPISGSQIRTAVFANATNATGLHELWWRASLYDHITDYMSALGDVTKKQPRNVVAVATYAVALYDVGVVRSRSEHPNTFQPQIDTSPEAVQKVLDQAKAISPRFWLISVGQSKLIPGRSGNFATMWKDKVNLARQAFYLKKNPRTYTNLANALFARAANENNMQVYSQCVSTLQQARKYYPKNPQVLASVYIYTYGHKVVDTNQLKADLLATIRPDLRQTPPLQRYFKQIWLK